MMVNPSWPRRDEQAEIQSRKAAQLANQIELQNHLWQISQGHNYRCQWCCRESLALLWTDINTCPLCHRKYDAIHAAEFEE